MKLLQSKEVKAPLLTAEAFGKLKVCKDPAETILKLLPAFPIANVWIEVVKPFNEVIALPFRKLENNRVVTFPETSVVRILVLAVFIPMPSNQTPNVV